MTRVAATAMAGTRRGRVRRRRRRVAGDGGELTIPVWWPPSSGDLHGERSARRGGSAGVARAESAATRELGTREAQARSGRGALGLRGTGKEELPEG